LFAAARRSAVRQPDALAGGRDRFIDEATRLILDYLMPVGGGPKATQSRRSER
jgi:hypothetical protein